MEEKEKKKKLTKKEKEELEKEKAKEKLKKIKIEKKPKKEEKKDETKEETPVEEKKKSIFKKIFTSYAFLISTFVILLIAVGILAFLVINYKPDPNKESADLFLPIIYSNTKNNIQVDLSELYRKGEYVMKITNYHGEKVNEEKIDYSILVKNAAKEHIRITKNEKTDNLMTDQESTKIDNGSLKGYIKQTDTYIITVEEKPKKGSELLLEITS